MDFGYLRKSFSFFQIFILILAIIPLNQSFLRAPNYFDSIFYPDKYTNLTSYPFYSSFPTYPSYPSYPSFLSQYDYLKIKRKLGKSYYPSSYMYPKRRFSTDPEMSSYLTHYPSYESMSYSPYSRLSYKKNINPTSHYYPLSNSYYKRSPRHPYRSYRGYRSRSRSRTHHSSYSPSSSNLPYGRRPYTGKAQYSAVDYSTDTMGSMSEPIPRSKVSSDVNEEYIKIGGFKNDVLSMIANNLFGKSKTHDKIKEIILDETEKSDQSQDSPFIQFGSTKISLRSNNKGGITVTVGKSIR